MYYRVISVALLLPIFSVNKRFKGRRLTSLTGLGDGQRREGKEMKKVDRRLDGKEEKRTNSLNCETEQRITIHKNSCLATLNKWLKSIKTFF